MGERRHGVKHLHVETLMLLLLSSHLTGLNSSQPVLCVNKEQSCNHVNRNREALQSFVQTVIDFFFFCHFIQLSSKLKVANSPLLNLRRWASSQEQISAHLKLSCAIFKQTKKKEEKIVTLIVTLNQNLLDSFFFPWLWQMQGMLLNI